MEHRARPQRRHRFCPRSARPENGTLHAAENAELFWVENLQATEGHSKLGPQSRQAKSAERDREWPSIVATSSGVVQAIDDTRISTRLEGGRNQTYQLRGKTAYFAAEQAFLAESQFLAGLPAAKAAFPNPRQVQWNPRDMLGSASSIDRYVALKALRGYSWGRPRFPSHYEHRRA